MRLPPSPISAIESVGDPEGEEHDPTTKKAAAKRPVAQVTKTKNAKKAKGGDKGEEEGEVETELDSSDQLDFGKYESGPIRQMRLTGDVAPGNAGSWFWVDVLGPFVLLTGHVLNRSGRK